MILHGDALTRLRELPTGSVQCCISSPPYYGLRDYGTDDQWAGGDPDCDHYQSELRRGVNLRDSVHSTRGGAVKAAEVGWIQYRDVCGKCGARRAGAWTGGDPECDHSQAATRPVGNNPSSKSTLTTNNGAGPQPGDKYHADQGRKVASACPCGARWTTGQLGLEATPEEYVERMVEVFREVRRVLRDDGTCWLNLGDSYAVRPTNLNQSPGRAARVGSTQRGVQRRVPQQGHKPKDLLGIPWMVAFALRADGWYLRSDIIWSKPNPMPESVIDRPTSAHEHIFLLTKSQRYFYDAEAIREESTGVGGVRLGAGRLDGPSFSGVPHEYESGAGRNKRNVWTIATQPYPEAHFATFPIKLVEPCLKAGSSPKACGVCGAPWERMLERTFYGNLRTDDNKDGALDLERGLTRNEYGGQAKYATYEPPRTTGWQPTCDHDDDTGSCVVLDPFAGSGTVGVVSELFGREFVGIELNADYCKMAERRILTEGRTGRRNQVPEQIDGQMALDLG